MSEKLTTQVIYTTPQATREAIDVLEEEANRLAQFACGEVIPHRVSIAISREIQRLRAISNALKP